ncbi:hypothetical protein SAMN05444166_0588 [Singulisphaera sp. GP187]|nr:hypothetical protein SAMN05444166_0588 [Singulisphaera sp. GP187]
MENPRLDPSRPQTRSSWANSPGAFADQKVIQTTLPRNPTKTIGCAVVASRNRSEGTADPTVGGSTAGSLPNRNQTVQASARVVTSAITALGQSNPF